MTKILMNKEALARTIKRLAHEIIEKNSGIKDVAIIGIQTRGVNIGRRIIKEIRAAARPRIKQDVPFGIMDIALYRDDINTRANPTALKETDIPFDITGKKIVLVDDVLYTGRSTRAALDGLMDMGRPQSIQLAVIIDREGHRELPIKADFVGMTYPTELKDNVVVECMETDGREQVVLTTK
jgi:pyrimidine operon attenuation protein/uracil phosphoribosyltransferase